MTYQGNYQEYKDLIQKYPQQFKDIHSYTYAIFPIGWMSLVIELIDKCIAINPNFEIVQIKEKFGGLRFYINGRNPDIEPIIHEYEGKCYHTCIKCGKPGDIKYGSKAWISPYCEQHRIDLAS